MADRQQERRARGRPRGSTDPQGGTLQSLDRALGVLTGLAQHGRSSLTDISLRLGVPTATAYRILTTLQKHGFAEFDEARQEWMVGVEAFRTGSAFLRRTTLVEASQPIMRRLMEETGETANLAVAQGSDVVFIGQVETQNPIRAFFQPGTRTPMHASGTGKALLAHMDRTRAEALVRARGLTQHTPNTLTSAEALFADLDRTRARGWSFDDQERYEGMSCIGAPIFDLSGAAFAGISVSGPTTRFTPRKVEQIGPLVRRAGEDIAAALGAAIRPGG